MSGSLKVVMPDFEALKDAKQLLVMGVIVVLGVGESTGLEGNGVDVTVGGHCNKIVVRIRRWYFRCEVTTPIYSR